LVDAHQTAGQHTLSWDGQREDGHEVASGLYFCRLCTADKIETIKMTLVK
jgi:hypothetical protein